MRATTWLAAVFGGVVVSTGRAVAHAGSLGGTLESAPIPTWLVVMTGGGVVGVSFLFTSFLTDHELIRALVGSRLRVPAPAAGRRGVRLIAGVVGVAGLATVVVFGLLGPPEPLSNPAILLVWAGWWAGYTMSVYLLVDTWSLVNPWRVIADWLPERGWRYPPALGSWPAVAGLLALVFVEVVTPIADDPRLLAGIVLAYTVVTVAGAVAVGSRLWFGTVDPVASVFRWYGRVAPIQRTDAGLELVSPGAALAEGEPVGADEVAFLVALLWVTTFDGFVSTPAWTAVVRPIVQTGLPALLVYLAAMLLGFGLFLGVYHLAARYARRTAETYVTASFVKRWFAPALVPIASGYHLAHFLGYFLSLAPALVGVLAQPLSPPASVTLLVLPGWYGSVQLLFVVLGHMLAVWVGHVLAFELFTGRLQPIRSQYPFVLAMVFYTTASLWVVSQPYVQPPFV